MPDTPAIRSAEENRIRAGLDTTYVKAVGAGVAKLLRRGRVVELAYQPGDMTRYNLVFVSVGWSPVIDAPRLDDVRAPHTDVFSPAERDGEWVAVAWLGHGAYQFRFAHWCRHDAGYIASKFHDCPYASSIALAELFQAICDAGGAG